MKRIMCVLAIIMVAFALPQPIIADPALVVQYMNDNTATVSITDAVRGVGFNIVSDGAVDVSVDQAFMADMPPINKPGPDGTVVGVYTKSPMDGVVATVMSNNKWTITNTKARTADGKFFEPTVHYLNSRGFRLAENYPNPFNPSTEIRYELDDSGQVDLAVYDVLGQRIATLVSETKSAGAYTVKWNATDDNGNRVTSGVYLYRLEYAGMSDTRRMILLK